jgi:lysophospholipase L1-like esterase
VPGTILHALLLSAVAAAVASAAAAHAGDDPGLRRDLERLSRRSVFFGHQSVGMNVLEGLAQLARENGVALRISEAGAPAPAPGVSHAYVARNGDPERKLRSFAQALAGGPGPEIALVKLCYADFDRSTDAAALFERYRAALAELRARHPRTAFVHVTAPLTAVQGGPRAWIKSLLGREPGGLEENARREQFNALLRQAYRGREPLFDLARVESTGPDGRVEALDRRGRPVPYLAPAWTDDGGHLNAEGRRRAARELVSVLAAIPGPPGGEPTR